MSDWFPILRDRQLLFFIFIHPSIFINKLTVFDSPCVRACEFVCALLSFPLDTAHVFAEAVNHSVRINELSDN